MRKKRRELILFCSLLLATTPAYAENATEAVSISDTASDIGWTIDANEEVQSVSESDTTQSKQSESQKIVKTEQHEEEQLPGQISVDDYVSERFELRDTNKEEIDVVVSVDDVAKKESSTTTENDLMQSLAHDYLTLYEREDGSETEWQAMHKQLADYFASLIKG